MTRGGAMCAADVVDVSVIIAAWKAAAFIEKAISSALASTGVSVEIIAVDDASPDETFEVLRRIADADTRVVALRLPSNSGPSAARNMGIQAAQGRYIAVLDADDAMAPGRLADLVATAKAANADIVVDNMTDVDETGRPLAATPFLKSADFAAARDIDLATWIRFNNPMSGGDTLGYLKPLIRRSKLVETGISYDPSLRNSEDYYLIANLLAAKSRMHYIPSAGYFYTRSPGSTSHRLKPDQTRAWLDAEARFVAQHGAILSDKERKAQAQRSRALRNVNQLIALIDTLKTRKLGASLRLMAADLHGATYALGVLSKVALGKMLGRKTV
ncbi:MAG: glycosyltransferase [Hyphomonadaceae bacterium]|nr:glycosyltransferase [Hyphomonadaceae bacterium]